MQRWYIAGINGSHKDLNLTNDNTDETQITSVKQESHRDVKRDLNLTNANADETQIRSVKQESHRDVRDLNLTNANADETQITSVKQVAQEVVDNLADILQLPQILKHIPKYVRSLTIVPDDILHGFPFAAMSYESKYLIERYALSIAYESKGRRVIPLSTSPKEKAVVVGVSNGSELFPPLPGVKRELRQSMAFWHSEYTRLSVGNRRSSFSILYDTVLSIFKQVSTR